MTFSFGKSLIHCVAFSTLFAATAAHAGNSFNKFPTQTTAPTSSSVNASGNYLKAQTTTVQRNRTTRIKRVVEPVAPTPIFTADMIQTQSDTTQQIRVNRFNKMQKQELKTRHGMPIVFSYNVPDAR